MNMASVCDESVENEVANPPARSGQWEVASRAAGALRYTPGESVTSSGPITRCARCRALVENPGVGRTTRCGQCRRRVRMPHHVHLNCARCGTDQRVSLRPGAPPQLCAQCGLEVVVTEALLPSARRRGSRRSRSSSVNYSDAAWAVLILGITVLICLMSITVL